MEEVQPPSHVSVDLTKNAKIKTINFNESDLITCFANDYGYENWCKRSSEFLWRQRRSSNFNKL